MRLTKDFVYTYGKNGHCSQWTVPENFKTDFASVPRWLNWLISPVGRLRRPAVVHDLHYREKAIPRFLADALLVTAAVEEGLPVWKACLAFFALRLFGWPNYGGKEP